MQNIAFNRPSAFLTSMLMSGAVVVSLATMQSVLVMMAGA